MSPPMAAATVVSGRGSADPILKRPGPAAASAAAAARLVSGSSNPPLAASGPFAR
ncbi:MAG TPA: hypothetical protein VG123_15350 [Streptosporangiaceae bacterium]|nr:hypothetical protein [Streptosporangiaceae bacterium]